MYYCDGVFKLPLTKVFAGGIVASGILIAFKPEA